MELEEFVAQCGEGVNELSRAVEDQEIGLIKEEKRILLFINRIGDLTVQEVLEGVREPITENRVWVEREERVFDQEVGRQVVEYGDRRGDRGNYSSHPQPRRGNPLTVAPFGHYAENLEREIYFSESPRKTEEI